MKQLIALFLFCSLCSSLSAQQTQWKWAKQYGSIDYENILDMATDRDGNVYGVGYLFQSGSIINSIVFGSTTLTTGGEKDGFVAKWDSTGSLKWIKQLKNAEDASVNRVLCDSTGNVFIAGSFLGTVDVGGVSLNAANSNSNFGNAFWAKLNPASGSAVWAKKLNLSTNPDSYVTIDALCMDKDGMLYLGGSFSGQLKASTSLSATAAGLKDGFVAQSSGTGQVNWLRTYGGGAGDVDDQSVSDLATDNQGSLYVGGNFFNYINISGTTQYSLENTPFVAKMSITTGSNAWFRFGGTSLSGFSAVSNTLSSLALDSAGNVYVCGNFGRDIVWGTTTLTNKDNTHYYGDFYVVKFSPSGFVSWAKSWGGASFDEYVYDIVVNKDGSYYIAGNYGSTTDFGSGAVTPVGGQGYNSAYLAKYTSGGALTWLRTVGNTTTPENGFFKCLTADRFGNLFVGGVVESGTFHYDNLVYSSNAANGNSDIGVARLRDKTVSTGIENSASTISFSVYPNPCTHRFTLNWDETGTMSILNPLAQLVHEQALVRGRQEIVLPVTLSQGIYFLQIQNAKGTANFTLLVE